MPTKPTKQETTSRLNAHDEALLKHVEELEANMRHLRNELAFKQFAVARMSVQSCHTVLNVINARCAAKL